MATTATAAEYPTAFEIKTSAWEGDHTSYTWQKNMSYQKIVGETPQFYIISDISYKRGVGMSTRRVKKTNIRFEEVAVVEQVEEAPAAAEFYAIVEEPGFVIVAMPYTTEPTVAAATAGFAGLHTIGEVQVVSGAELAVMRCQLFGLNYSIREMAAPAPVEEQVATEPAVAGLTTFDAPATTPEELRLRSDLQAAELGRMIDGLGTATEEVDVAAHPVATIKAPHHQSEDKAGPYSERYVEAGGVVIGAVHGGPRRGWWFDADAYNPGKVQPTMMAAVEQLVAAHLAAEEEYPYTLAYYGRVASPEPPRGFYSLREAGQWATANNVPMYLLHVTQWDLLTEKNGHGLRERINSCNLEDAYTRGSVTEKP